MKHFFITLIGLLIGTQVLVAQEEDLTILDNWLAYTDAPNALYHHLHREAVRFLGEREAQVGRLQTAEDWAQWQVQQRERLQAVVGPLPERTPLNARVVGTSQADGFRVEKVIYESQPGFYVTAALFVPDNLQGSTPAIVYCSGHTEVGFRSEVYQLVIQNLARKGFIVLAFDPVGQGERLQYPDEEGASRVGSATREHSYPGAQQFLLGSSLARTMIWDGIRSIDYLMTRPEVDPDRIGITGRSGGGTQAAYIAAFDERIRASAPENYITSFRRLLESIGPQDAEQNFYRGLAAGIDQADLLLVRAPKPTLMITTTGDFFSIQGARETYGELKQAYTAFDRSGDMQMVEDVGGHGSTVKNREAMYRFFQQALRHPGPSTDELLPPLPEDVLQITSTGQVLTSLDGTSIFDLIRTRSREVMGPWGEQSTSGRVEDQIDQARHLSGYREPEQRDEAVFAGHFERPGYRVERYFMSGEGGYRIPFLLMRPDGPGPFPAVVFLDPEGKANQAGAGGLIEKLVQQGNVVLAPDVLGYGELSGGAFRGDAYEFSMGVGAYNHWFFAMQVGRSLVGIQAGDVVQSVQYLQGRSDVDAGRISSIAFGTMGPVLQHAAAFEPTIRRMAVVGSLLSYHSLVEHIYYQPSLIHATVPGALTAYDLPDLTAAAAPRPVLWINPVDEMNHTASADQVEKTLKPVQAVYDQKEASEKFQTRLLSDSEEVDEAVLSWTNQ